MPKKIKRSVKKEFKIGLIDGKYDIKMVGVNKVSNYYLMRFLKSKEAVMKILRKRMPKSVTKGWEIAQRRGLMDMAGNAI